MRMALLAMVIDSSALLSILLGEEDADKMVLAIAGDPKRLVSSVTLLETSIVVEARKGAAGGRELDLLIHSAQMEVVSLTSSQTELAREAYRRYGKGRHPAKLNTGDCCSYALARHSGERLLYKGEGLGKTDIPTAL